MKPAICVPTRARILRYRKISSQRMRKRSCREQEKQEKDQPRWLYKCHTLHRTLNFANNRLQFGNESGQNRFRKYAVGKIAEWRPVQNMEIGAAAVAPSFLWNGPCPSRVVH